MTQRDWKPGTWGEPPRLPICPTCFLHGGAHPRERAFWVLWVPPKRSHTYPHTRAAGKCFTPTHRGRTGAAWPQAKDRWQHRRLEEAWTGPSCAARGAPPALPTPGSGPSEAGVGLLASREKDVSCFKSPGWRSLVTATLRQSLGADTQKKTLARKRCSQRREKGLRVWGTVGRILAQADRRGPSRGHQLREGDTPQL